eukprot:CAMPEP_0197448082 /NCGR_PEP_ID=MMETSP1175-20131217/16056_1 /TAXON_ID=1003142 /ORGANISM="Triceratium dubium, Strain CCMP147" /LENGTH=35 /DNA_ID= /DNA_START= /DNA_END= /DNA_ORIENTATION=
MDFFSGMASSVDTEAALFTDTLGEEAAPKDGGGGW